MQPSIGDTMKDLLLGQLGATVYALAVISSAEKRTPVLQAQIASELAALKTTH